VLRLGTAAARQIGFVMVVARNSGAGEGVGSVLGGRDRAPVSNAVTSYAALIARTRPIISP